MARKTELAFDLESVRKLKRLTKRVLKGLEQIERHLVKFRKPRQPRPTSPEVAAAMDFYGVTTEDIQTIKANVGDAPADPLAE